MAFAKPKSSTVKYATTDSGVNMSTNQIYAGLMAYKVQRDLGIAANIFA